MKPLNLRKCIACALLAAVSVVLFLIQVPTPLTPEYLKLDLSDLPALLAGYFLGIPYGIIVCLLKNATGLFHTFTGGVGELSNFILSSAFVLGSGLIYRKNQNLRGAALGAAVGALAAAAVSFPSNLFLVYPVYGRLMGMDAILGMYRALLPGVEKLWQGLLVFNVPFTLVKCLLSGFAAVLVWKPLKQVRILNE
ncbi:MAG: ECF transporter S component [Oscillospiraceae bacterium]|jgi:riboflavin transporter FmnP|nr:ECF transporter S component [Oscillospiraceae bacterium]